MGYSELEKFYYLGEIYKDEYKKERQDFFTSLNIIKGLFFEKKDGIEITEMSLKKYEKRYKKKVDNFSILKTEFISFDTSMIYGEFLIKINNKDIIENITNEIENTVSPELFYMLDDEYRNRKETNESFFRYTKGIEKIEKKLIDLQNSLLYKENAVVHSVEIMSIIYEYMIISGMREFYNDFEENVFIGECVYKSNPIIYEKKFRDYFKKEENKQNIKNNLFWGVGVVILVSIIISFFTTTTEFFITKKLEMYYENRQNNKLIEDKDIDYKNNELYKKTIMDFYKIDLPTTKYKY